MTKIGVRALEDQFLWLYLQSVPQPVAFSSFDERLNRAAREVRVVKRP